LLVRFLVLVSMLSKHGNESGGFEDGGFIGSTSEMGFGAAAWDDSRALLLMKRVRGFVLRAERTMLRETAARGLEVLMLV
jgi:hypothetical protein